MVLDSSVLVALLLNEPEADLFEAVLDAAPIRLLSAANLLEAALVVENRLGEPGASKLDSLIIDAEIEIVPVDRPLVEIARDCFRRFGRGRHAAGLNFGDCFSYALAASSGLPLLFKGGDFAKTDIRAVDLASYRI